MALSPLSERVVLKYGYAAAKKAGVAITAIGVPVMAGVFGVTLRRRRREGIVADGAR